MARVIRRWVATCAVVEFDKHDRKQECGFNGREHPTLHPTSEAALRESVAHVRTQHEVTGAREVQVRRTYTPRMIASEEVLQ